MNNNTNTIKGINRQSKKNIPTNKEYLNRARLTGCNREIKEIDTERKKGM